jgi:hypothetical protein
MEFRAGESKFFQPIHRRNHLAMLPLANHHTNLRNLATGVLRHHTPPQRPERFIGYQADSCIAVSQKRPDHRDLLPPPQKADGERRRPPYFASGMLRQSFQTRQRVTPRYRSKIERRITIL